MSISESELLPPLGMRPTSLYLLYGSAVEFVADGILISTRWQYGHNDTIPVIVHHQIPTALLKAPATHHSIRIGHQHWPPNEKCIVWSDRLYDPPLPPRLSLHQSYI